MLKTKKGQSLIELILTMALAAVLIPALYTGIISSREGKFQQNQRLEAVTLLKEAEEAVRVVRESGWSNISTNGTYYPQISGNTWSLVAGTQNISTFTRNIAISDVYRDANGTIIPTGTVNEIDASTKKVVIAVSWTQPYSSSVISTLYLTRYQDNITFTHTTDVDFNAGTKMGTSVTNTSGGEVILTSGGSGNWCNPNLSISSLDVPKNGEANALYAIEGEAFVGTGSNASGPDFVNISITDTNPPVPSIIGTYDPNPTVKTNDLVGEGNYSYLATDDNNKELIILDISGSPTEVGSFNIPGSTDAMGIYVAGNTAYITKGGRLWNVNVINKSSPSLLDLDGVGVTEQPTKVMVVGNYAYVVARNDELQLVIVDVSNPSNLQVVGQAQLDEKNGVDVYVNETGTYTFVITNNDAEEGKLHVVDVRTKTGQRPVIGTYDTGPMHPQALTIVSGNKGILVGREGEEYQVVNIDINTSTNTATISHCGGLEVDSGINDVAGVIESSDGDVYAYILTRDENAEFRIIGGGSGSQYASSGTFESNTYAYPNLTSPISVAFNRFDVNFSEPPSTDIKFQFAIADVIGGSCSGVTFNFVGPSADPSQFFDDDGPIPLHNDGTGYENPAQCFRYKAFLSTTDPSQTPVLYDITVNHSP